MTRPSKYAFCPDCNSERPTYKDYLYKADGKKAFGWKVTVCIVCRKRVFVENKYKAKPTRSKHTGRMFDSKKEADREPTLLAMQNAGHICELKYQVPYILEVYSTTAVDRLLDYFRLYADAFEGDPITTPLVRDIERSRHKIAKYVADFTYEDKHGNLVVEDVKGRATATYRLKKKLMLACHGIEIVEPSVGGVENRARGAGVSGRGTGSRFKGHR